jgi:8-oxo-dGTP diphosphatase
MEEQKKHQITVVIGVIVYQDKIFFTKRHDPGSPYDKKWEIPGGKIDHGEQPLEAVVREIKEETGFDIKVLQLLPIETAMHASDLQVIMIPYLCMKIGGEFSAEDSKTLDGEFMNLKEMSEHEFLPRDTEIATLALAAHKEYLKTPNKKN